MVFCRLGAAACSALFLMKAFGCNAVAKFSFVLLIKWSVQIYFRSTLLLSFHIFYCSYDWNCWLKMNCLASLPWTLTLAFWIGSVQLPAFGINIHQIFFFPKSSVFHQIHLIVFDSLELIGHWLATRTKPCPSLSVLLTFFTFGNVNMPFSYSGKLRCSLITANNVQVVNASRDLPPSFNVVVFFPFLWKPVNTAGRKRELVGVATDLFICLFAACGWPFRIVHISNLTSSSSVFPVLNPILCFFCGFFNRSPSFETKKSFSTA